MTGKFIWQGGVMVRGETEFFDRGMQWAQARR
jgi:hypothetical protein